MEPFLSLDNKERFVYQRQISYPFVFGLASQSQSMVRTLSWTVGRSLPRGNYRSLGSAPKSCLSTLSSSLPPDEGYGGEFKVTTRRGFLPLHDPLARLPKRFALLEDLLQTMPVQRSDGQAGLLARGQLGDASLAVPEYDVADIDDVRLLHGSGPLDVGQRTHWPCSPL